MIKKKKTGKKSKLLSFRFSGPTLLLLLSVFTLFGAAVYFLTGASTNNAINPTDEKNHLARINNHRTSTHDPSRGSLYRNRCLTDIARNWSKHLSSYGVHHNSADWHKEYGTSGYIKDPRTGSKTTIKYHTHGSYLVSQVSKYCSDAWSDSIAENVGSGGSESQLYSAFLNSSAHHSNLHYDPYNFIGIGDYVSSNGVHNITQIYTRCVSGGSRCGGSWEYNPADHCKVAGPSDGLLYNGGFELQSFGTRKWNDIKIVKDSRGNITRDDTNQWQRWRSDGDNINRADISDPHRDCWVQYNRDIESGAVSTAQVVKGEAGKSYTLRAWHKYAEHSGNQTLYLDFLDKNFGRIDVKGNPATVSTTHNTSWLSDPLSVTATAPSGTYYIRVILYGSTSTGTTSNFYWDSVGLFKN